MDIPYDAHATFAGTYRLFRTDGAPRPERFYARVLPRMVRVRLQRRNTVYSCDVRVWRDGVTYVAELPTDLLQPPCAATAATEAEALRLFGHSLDSWLDLMEEHGA